MDTYVVNVYVWFVDALLSLTNKLIACYQC